MLLRTRCIQVLRCGDKGPFYILLGLPMGMLQGRHVFLGDTSLAITKQRPR